MTDDIPETPPPVAPPVGEDGGSGAVPEEPTTPSSPPEINADSDDGTEVEPVEDKP